MNCIKRLGERMMPRTFERQDSKLHIRAAILNRLRELRRPQAAAVAWPRLGFGGARFRQGLCNSTECKHSMCASAICKQLLSQSLPRRTFLRALETPLRPRSSCVDFDGGDGVLKKHAPQAFDGS